MYRCKHFIIEELVPKHILDKYGNVRSWQFFDVRLLETLDKLRERFGSLSVNDWKWGGNFSQRGLRDFDYGGIENRSLHKSGMAIDCVSKTVTAQEMREYIIYNQDEFPYLIGLELGVNWLHFDTRNREGNNGRLFTFYPSK